jgi:hypothetical protein
MESPATGQMVFAKSADGRYYVASVLSAGKESFRVRFMSGGEAQVNVLDMRTLSLTPGQKIEYLSASSGGWWTGTISEYNHDAKRLEISSWGGTEKTGLEGMRLKGETAASPNPLMGKLAIVLTGGVVGALLHWLFTR